MTISTPASSADRLPSPGAGFVWDAGSEATVLRPITDRARAVFSTRLGGIDVVGGEGCNVSWRNRNAPAVVMANRGVLSRMIGSTDERWSSVRQVHGAEAVEATDPRDPPAGDAVWTDVRQRTIAVLAADCLPVLLVGDGRIAAAHAGWRGILAGVVQNAAAAIGPVREAFVGPGIGPCCFEVGPDVAALFGGSTTHADLWAAAERAATLAGAARVEVAGLCTSCHVDVFFSHRREAGRTGRQALVARLP